MEGNNCAICNIQLNDDDKITRVSRGLQTFLTASEKRGDGKHVLWATLSYLFVHESCRKRYIDVRSVSAASKRKRSSTSTDETESQAEVESEDSTFDFDFENNCFICGQLCQRAIESKKKMKYRRQICLVSPNSTIENQIRNSIIAKNDEWAEDVNKRIMNVSSLHEVAARFHWDCRVKFLERKSTRQDDKQLSIKSKFLELVQYMQNSEDCQWSLNDLKAKMDCEISSYRLKNMLEEKYGNEIVFTDNRPHSAIITFKRRTHKILKENFNELFPTDAIERKQKIIELAADIINEEICEKAYNKHTYPASSTFLNNVEDVIPESLSLFLEQVILKRKRNPSYSTIKITSIAHAIMAATRPKSFISPLLLAVSTYVHRKFESRLLIDILSKLGFGNTYTETLLYEASATMHGQKDLPAIDNIFLQYAFDNADYDVHTIDGKNTFHYTGGIECITPHSSIPLDDPIPRLKVFPEEAELAMKASIPIKKFDNYGFNGLAKITILDLDKLHPSEPRSVQLIASEILWVTGKWLRIKDFPEWNGFMEHHTQHHKYKKSAVRFLPFINLKSSDDDALYTALTFACKQVKAVHQGTTFVTFDQPLYIKAWNIIATIIENNKDRNTITNEGDDSIINCQNVVVKLGGFHLLMSFLGSIGYIMQGSGLKEAWSSTGVYAEQSIESMMSGKHYSRAIRAHVLTQSALIQMLLDESHITMTDREEIANLLETSRKVQKDDDIYNQFLQSIQTEEPSEDHSSLSVLTSSPITLELENKLKLHIEDVESKNGLTAKLWLQYINLISLTRSFIMAERMGDWELHLSCIQHMLPYFHSTGHNLYAKSAHLYLQDMINLKDTMIPSEYEAYTKKGYFTIRRTNKFWSGIWTDMTIEQTLMRSMHSRGGITRGRGITESVVSNWINAMPTSIHICEALEEYTEVRDESSEQHKDVRDSSITANERDTRKLLEWFQQHSPFIPNDKIMSLSTGVCGDDSINCWNAKEVGIKLLKDTVGDNFANVSYKRSQRIQPLSAMQSGVKVGNSRITVNSTFIFQRMLRLHPSEEELKAHFYYELSPFPPALFDENGMRKSSSSNFDFFTPEEESVNINFLYIIDGEWLLTHIMWQLRVTYAVVYNYFIEYIKKYFGQNTLVVFNLDNNYAGQFPKFAEQKRINRKYNCGKIIFDETKLVTVHGQKLLTNRENKNLFISQLCNAFNNNGINYKLLGTTESTPLNLIDIDADEYIINESIKLAQEKTPVCIVTNNADFLYTLTSMTPTDNDIYLLKVVKKETRWYSIHKQRNKYPYLYPYFSVLHALSGCSTTSALFSIGKKTVFTTFKKLISNPNVECFLKLFNDETSTMDTIKVAGEQLMLNIYKASADVQTLNDLRSISFHQLINRSKKEIHLSNLPPTSEAAHQHCYRAYHQVQAWKGVIKSAESWGWYLDGDTLSPVMTTSVAVPDVLYNMISCGCSKGCRSNACTCKKNGLKCTYACKHCAGSGCENSENITIGETDEEQRSLEQFCEYPASLALLANVEMEVDEDDYNQPSCSKQ